MGNRFHLPQIQEEICLFSDSDRAAEYNHKELKVLLTKKGIKHSRSDKSSHWQNSWQESFYSQFKLELGGTQSIKVMKN